MRLVKVNLLTESKKILELLEGLRANKFMLLLTVIGAAASLSMTKPTKQTNGNSCQKYTVDEPVGELYRNKKWKGKGSTEYITVDKTGQTLIYCS